MKKLILVLSVFFVVASMSSCTKTYNCDCTWEDVAGEAQTSSVELEGKKSDAEAACSSTETGLKVIDANASCTLK